MEYSNPKQTLIILKELKRVAPQLNLNRLQEQLAALAKEIENGKYTVVVAGEVKKGKSSLINSLLDLGELLPAPSDVATSTAFRIIYGPKRKNTVYFTRAPKEDDLETQPRPENRTEPRTGRVIEDDELITYGTEQGNPDNIKQVDYIQIELPNEVLRDGLEIVDSPGLGGILPYHSQITWKYIPTADAVLFIFDSVDAPITRDEENWIRKIKNFTSLIVYAQTKIDLASSEQWKSWQNRNLDGLAQILESSREEIIYFPVSSIYKAASDGPASKPYERSGFAPLEDFFFNRLQQEVLERKCLHILALLQNGLNKKKQELEQEIKVLEETSVKNLEDLKERYTAIINNLKDLESRVYPDLREDFYNNLDRIYEDGIQSINALLHQAQVNPEISGYIATLRQEGKSPDQINKNIDQLTSRFIDEMSQKVLIFYQHYRNEILDLVDKYTDLLHDHLEKTDTLSPDLEKRPAEKDMYLGDAKRELGSLNSPKAEKLKFNKWDATRNFVIGGGMGSSLGGGIGTLIIAIVYPPALIYAGLASLAGGVLGLIFSGISAKQKNEKQILSHLQSVLFGLMNQLQRKITHQFKSDVKEIKMQANKEFKRIIRETKEFNEKQLQTIKHQIDQDGKVNQDKVKEVRQHIHTISNMLNYIQKIA